MNIKIGDKITVELYDTSDWCAEYYDGEYSGPSDRGTQSAVRRGVLRAVAEYGLTVHRVTVRPGAAGGGKHAVRVY